MRSNRTLKQKNACLAGIMSACILLGACSSNVVVSPPATFPEPLVEPLPLRLGVHYPEEFKNYTYEQPPKQTSKKKKKKKRSKFRVAIGEAQTQLMRTIFGALFTSVKTVDADALTTPSDEFDLLLVPEVLEFQFSTPRVTKVNVYEIWIKYQFSLQAADGEEITTWIVPVYGKTPTKFLKSKDAAVNLATLVALRDCGAAFITGFPRVPEIRDWLAKDFTANTATETAR
ncbi:MAG: hypothetical protein ACR2PS_06550 [Pseudomonadales bacterium]